MTNKPMSAEERALDCFSDIHDQLARDGDFSGTVDKVKQAIREAQNEDTLQWERDRNERNEARITELETAHLTVRQERDHWFSVALENKDAKKVTNKPIEGGFNSEALDVAHQIEDIFAHHHKGGRAQRLARIQVIIRDAMQKIFDVTKPETPQSTSRSEIYEDSYEYAERRLENPFDTEDK